MIAFLAADCFLPYREVNMGLHFVSLRTSFADRMPVPDSFQSIADLPHLNTNVLLPVFTTRNTPIDFVHI